MSFIKRKFSRVARVVTQINCATITEFYFWFQISLTGSCYTTVAITVERFLAVRSPFFIQRHNIKARLFILPVLFYAVLYNIPRFFEFRVNTSYYPCQPLSASNATIASTSTSTTSINSTTTESILSDFSRQSSTGNWSYFKLTLIKYCKIELIKIRCIRLESKISPLNQLLVVSDYLGVRYWNFTKSYLIACLVLCMNTNCISWLVKKWELRVVRDPHFSCAGYFFQIFTKFKSM